MKKVLLILMTLCVALPALAADFYDEESGLYYNITSEEGSENPTVEVTYGGTLWTATPEYTGEITIPETVEYDGTPYTVTAIGEGAFSSCDLTAVSIPETVTSIGYGSFYYATLKSIDIPDNVTTMGTYAFQYSSLESVTIGSGLKEIPAGTFSLCSSLKEVTIPEGIVSIGQEAFYYATHLKSIDIPDNVTKIGEYAFQFSYSLESVTFGSGLTEISRSAFSSCTSLKGVSIPEGVVSIGDWAFELCSSLAKVSLPSTLTSLGNRTFMDCGLKEIVVADGNEYYCAVDSVLFTKDMTTIVQYPVGLEATTYEIPSGVTKIGDSAFSAGLNLTSVTIPASVTTIESYAFCDCVGITSITILCETAPTCANYVFYDVDTSNIILYVPNGCSSAYSSTSPWSGFDIVEIVEEGEKECIDGIYYIVGDGTLTVTYGGDSYENGTEGYTGDITIPGTIVYAGTQCTVAVGEYAFANCTGITSITVDSETPPTCAENAFTGLTTSEITLYVPYGCKSAYSAVSPWSGFNIVEIVAEKGDRIKVDGIYYNIITETELEVTYGGTIWNATPEYTGEITIPETVTYQGTTYTVTGIGEGAFSNCYLAAVNIPETVTSIGYSSFYNMYYLISLDIPNSVTTIDKDAFGYCYGLISVTLGSNLTSMGDYAFDYAGYDTGVLALTVLNPTPPTLGTYVFYGSNATVYVPAGTLAEYNRVWGTQSGVSSMNELDYAVLKIGSTGYSTYYNEDYDIDISATGIKAYWAEGIEDEDGTSVVTLMNIGTTIPAKTAVVFNGAQTDLTEASATAPSAESEYSSNMLHGQSTTGTFTAEEGYLYYILTTGGDNGEVGFYYGAEDGGAFESAANKAWLAVPEDEQRNGLSIKFKDEDDTTGISSVNMNYGKNDGNIYTIQGIRVNDMSRPGIYIVNGKKVLVK